MEKSYTRHPSSYRDPSGFVFIKDDVLYRQVNKVYAADYDLLNSSGLYSKLIEKKWLIPHESINQNLTGNPDWYITLKPEPVAVITYPYEWSFDMHTPNSAANVYQDMHRHQYTQQCPPQHY